MDGQVPEVSQFIPTIHKSTKQFIYSFANDFVKVLNGLPNDIWSATSLPLGRN